MKSGVTVMPKRKRARISQQSLYRKRFNKKKDYRAHQTELNLAQNDDRSTSEKMEYHAQQSAPNHACNDDPNAGKTIQTKANEETIKQTHNNKIWNKIMVKWIECECCNTNPANLFSKNTDKTHDRLPAY